MPRYDDDFQKWCRTIAGRLGWPRGPVNAMELWNEPWEGASISGWAPTFPAIADVRAHGPRHCRGARAGQGGGPYRGTCSSMNTEDKLFCDGKDTFLQWLDFTSIHYQPMASLPTLIPAWMERKSPLVPSGRGTPKPGLRTPRTLRPGHRLHARPGPVTHRGVLHTVIPRCQLSHDPCGRWPDRQGGRVQAWACGAGIAAGQHFMGERVFKELLFTNGLPWSSCSTDFPRPMARPTRTTARCWLWAIWARPTMAVIC